jgi:hypothetical protein
MSDKLIDRSDLKLIFDLFGSELRVLTTNSRKCQHQWSFPLPVVTLNGVDYWSLVAVKAWHRRREADQIRSRVRFEIYARLRKLVHNEGQSLGLLEAFYEGDASECTEPVYESAQCAEQV